MPEHSSVTPEGRSSFLLGAASVGAEVLAVTDAWSFRALAGEDVVGFCRTSLASGTAFVFVLLRFGALAGMVVVPLLVIVGLVRGGLRRNLLPGFAFAIVLLLYFAGLRAHALPEVPRHPCLRSEATFRGPAALV